MFKSIFLNRWECLPSQWKELRNGRPRYTLLSLKCVFYWFAQQSPIWQPNISVEPGLPQNHPNHQSCFLSFSLQIRLHLITIAHLVINILVLVLLFYFCWSATMPEWVVTCAQELHNPLFFQLFLCRHCPKHHTASAGSSSSMNANFCHYFLLIIVFPHLSWNCGAISIRKIYLTSR